tara:strand:+ start:15 stop:416 length:402 start_codon:yes stop_codon:yes gene_type:complete
MLAVAESPTRRIKEVPERPLNDIDGVLWGLGWYLKKVRLSGDFDEATLKAFGKVLDMSTSGYQKLETGDSPNLRAWFQIFNHTGKQFSQVLMLVETILSQIYRKEDILGRELDKDERAELAEQIYTMIDKLQV